MREILFRGKRIDNGEWVEGSLITEYYKNHGVVMISPSEDETYKVDPNTVGQYTGLNDKNRKKIFEGDIISVPGSKKPGLPGIVIFHQLDAKYILFRQRYSYLNLINVNEWGYVIGNIHDNPELMEDKP